MQITYIRNIISHELGHCNYCSIYFSSKFDQFHAHSNYIKFNTLSIKNGSIYLIRECYWSGAHDDDIIISSAY